MVASLDGVKLRVLVVDDDARVRRSLARLLSTLDAEVESVADPHQALEALRQRRFDAVVSDQLMPGGASGTEFLARVQREYPAVRRVLTTGLLDPDEDDDSGAVELTVHKPWTRDAFEHLRKWLADSP